MTSRITICRASVSRSRSNSGDSRAIRGVSGLVRSAGNGSGRCNAAAEHGYGSERQCSICDDMLGGYTRPSVPMPIRLDGGAVANPNPPSVVPGRPPATPSRAWSARPER